MKVLVDTTVWSLALRRTQSKLSSTEAALVDEWRSLVRDGRVVLLGVVRQELLSGIRRSADFDRLRLALRAFDDEAVTTEDHEHAARLYNRCRAGGVTGTTVDLLLCAVAERRKHAIFTADPDFAHYAKHVSVTLHESRAIV